MKKVKLVLWFYMTFIFSIYSLNAEIINAKQIIKNNGEVLLPKQLNKSQTMLSSNIAGKENAINNFKNKNGKWTIMFDKVLNTPFRASGEPSQINNITKITNQNAEAAVKQFISDNNDLFSITISDLKFINAVKVGNLFYISFGQTYKGLDILLSKIQFRVRTDAKVIAFNTSIYNNIGITTEPKLTYSNAMVNATKGMESKHNYNATLATEKLYVLPFINGNKVNYKLVYKYKISGDKFEEKFDCFIDANSGDVVWRYNTTHQATNVNQQGDIYLKNRLDNITNNPYKYQYIKINGSQYTTDANGKISANISNPSTLTTTFEGPWTKLISLDFSRPVSSVNSNINPGDNLQLNWNDNNSNLVERMLFYHCNNIHDYARTIDTNLNNMSYQVSVKLDYSTDSTQINASSGGDTINFYAIKAKGNHLWETPLVLYHEYGHSINFFIYDNVNGSVMQNSMAQEGTADLFACLMQDTPYMAIGTFDNPNKLMRNLENNCIYPDSLSFDGHISGQILSGAFWDLKKITDHDFVVNLSHFTKYGTPEDEEDGKDLMAWFQETLITDDNLYGDNNINNGTPHISQIVQAFNKHNIGTNLLIGSTFEHIPLANTNDTINSFNVKFNVSEQLFGMSAIDSISLVWTNDNFITLNKVNAILTPSGEYKYSAFIPKQESGTIVKYYFTAYDKLGKSDLRFPITQSPHYYQFLVNFISNFKDSFSNNPNWKIGDTKDSASTGQWEYGVPDEMIYDFGNGGSILQPKGGYPENDQNCYATGLKYDESSQEPIYSFLPNGLTTLTTKSFDITNLKNPLFRFNYWFFNLSQFPMPAYNGRFSINISSDNGITWNVVKEFSDTSNGGWKSFEFAVEDYATKSSQMKLKFVVNVFSFNFGGGFSFTASITKALIDDFEILSAPINSTYVDNLNLNENNIENDFNIYPNPIFNNQFYCNYNLNKDTYISISLYNTLSEKILDISDGIQLSGNHNLKVNAGNLSKGIYLCKLIINGQIQTKHIIIF